MSPSAQKQRELISGSSHLDDKALAPCPFCGRDGTLDPYSEPDGQYYVYCSGHKAGCRCDLGCFDSKSDAIVAWNRRASALVPADVAEVVERLEEEVVRLSGRSLDFGSADSGIAANLAMEAASLITSLTADNARMVERIAELEARLEHVTELLVDTWHAAMPPDNDPEQEIAVINARALLNKEGGRS